MPISGKQHVLGKPAVGGRLGCWVAVMSHCSDTGPEMGDWHKMQGDTKEMFFFVCFCFVCRFSLVLYIWWPFAPVSWATWLYVRWSSVVHTTLYCRAYLTAHSCIHWSSCFAYINLSPCIHYCAFLCTWLSRLAYINLLPCLHRCIHWYAVVQTLVCRYAYIIVYSYVDWPAIVHTLVYRCAYTIVHSCVHWSAVIAVHKSVCTLVCCRTHFSLRCLCINESDAVHTKLCWHAYTSLFPCVEKVAYCRAYISLQPR